MRRLEAFRAEKLIGEGDVAWSPCRATRPVSATSAFQLSRLSPSLPGADVESDAARWDDAVQHYRVSLVVSLDRPARLFLCVGCRVQVVLCNCCNHGDRYRSRACRRQQHDLVRREAACRYQRPRGGRASHAARSQRWRERIALRAAQGDDGVAGTVSLGSEHKVTHQGSCRGCRCSTGGMQQRHRLHHNRHRRTGISIVTALLPLRCSTVRLASPGLLAPRYTCQVGTPVAP